MAAGQGTKRNAQGAARMYIVLNRTFTYTKVHFAGIVDGRSTSPPCRVFVAVYFHWPGQCAGDQWGLEPLCGDGGAAGAGGRF